MYTDYFGQPLAPGDTIVYPVQRGSSAATLNEGVIEAFINLIPHRDNPKLLMREDQAKKPYPTTYYHDVKPYLVKVRVKKTTDGKHMARTITNVFNIVKGPST